VFRTISYILKNVFKDIHYSYSIRCVLVFDIVSVVRSEIRKSNVWNVFPTSFYSPAFFCNGYTGLQF